MGDGGVNAVGEGVNQSHVLFDRFVQATTFKGTLKAFQELCDFLELKPNEYRVFYHKLKSKLNYWKAKALWVKLDKRASHKEYKKGRACANAKCLIIGAGPCGLRTAIELGFLGAKVVLLEKRDAFSRNNVLHLWPYTIQDLRGLGAKKFYGKFCAGAIDHISIRQLQLMLLKVALLLGIEIHVNVEFKGLIEPPEDQENERIGWRAEVHPRTHPVNELEFDVIIGADGRRNTLSGFRRKEFRGKLAIAITANFINRNTTAEAKVEEISGVAFIFNQKFFQDLREATGIDLENIVYYKDDTHYFVMTAKKQSLLEKGVILHDYADTEMLLSRANVDQKALLSYAREAADFSTNQQLPKLDFAINHYGQPDVAMFDFTCMYASENAALVRQRNGHKLLVALVGDSLLEPFWPMGTGIARGFLAGMDAAWMVRSWANGSSPLEVLAERESVYRLLPQTTPENVSKNFSHYSVDPATRYPNISLHQVRPNQVRHLLDTGETRDLRIDMENVVNSSTPKLTRNEILLEKQLQESIVRSSKLLNWCQRQTEGYRGVSVSDLTTSWKSGLALCALIHRYRPDLIDFDSLDEKDVEKNNQMAFDVAEKEFGISPIMTGKEMSGVVEPDKLSMVMYLSQFYEMFKDTVPPGENHNLSPEEKAALIASTKSPISFLSKLGQSIAISRKRNPKDKKEKELDVLGKRRKTSQTGQSEDEELQRVNRDERPSIATALAERKIDSAAAANNNNKVKSMATQLLAKFEENAPTQSTGLKRQGDSMPNLGLLLTPSLPAPSLTESVLLASVPAWRKRRTQLQEQMSFRYKERLKCQTLLFKQEQASSGTEVLRSCPKKTILLSSSSPSSSSSSSSFLPHTQGSLRKEFPQNIGGSDVCFFCRKRVYVMERLSAEGKFFHRSCFKCDYCGTTLRLSSYAFDVEDGKFYCKPHYCYRLSGLAQRKRPAPAAAPSNPKEPQVLAVTPNTVDAPGQAITSQAPVELRPSVTEVNGVTEPSVAKRLKGTPERIELENYRLSMMREEELEEVPEETQAEHNLSSVLDKPTDIEEGSSSSESDMEEEDEEPEATGPSDLGGVPWKEAVKLHTKLKGESDPGAAEDEDGLHYGDGEMDEDEEEEEDDEDEDEEEEESSDAGEYLPWERELQSGLWLENLANEEDTGKFKAGNLHIQQAIHPVDPLDNQMDKHWTSKQAGRVVEGPSLSPLGSQPSLNTQLTQPTSSTAPSHKSIRHEAVRAWLDSMSEEPCEEDDDAEAGSPDFEPGTEIDQEDIPSDAEAEARSHCIDEVVTLPVDMGKPESQGHVFNTEKTSANPRELIVDVVLSPIQKPALPIEEVKEVSPVILVKSPGARFFPEPYLPGNAKLNIPPPQSPDAKRPHSPVAQIVALSPICSQPVPQPEMPSPKSPVQPCACSPTGNPLSPMCTQSQPCHEPPSPLSTSSPVRTQPVPAVTSTPLAKPASENRNNEPLNDSAPEETPVKKTDLIEEFWMKSAEIRKSLGLSPLDRSKITGEKSIVKAPTPESSSPRSYTPEDLSEEQKPTFTGRSIIRRINITLEGQVISPVEPKSNSSEKKDLSSSSGLGLNGSVTTSQTATSDSYNNSDSTMLTPPSSPPPPPPNEEPAALQNKRPQASWDNLLEGTEEPKSETMPPKPKTPVSPRQPQSVMAPVPTRRTNPPVVMRVKEPNKPRREEVRKSFVECVEEIPFADDVEDTYDDRTPDTSGLERFYTPPTSKVNRDKPPFHLALAMENGKPSITEGVSRTAKNPQHFSPEAKEIAEERMRAREKSVKSQALKDAMAKQLSKMKETEAAKGAVAKVAWNVPETTGKNKKQLNAPKDSAVKALESKKQTDILPDRFLTTPARKTLDSSVTSSESSTGGKSKKRSSLFSPRKNKKEKKAKNERLSGTEETPPKHKSLWKAVFSGYKKDKKKKDNKSCPSTPSSSTTVDSGKKKESPLDRSSDLRLRRNLSFSEESDLSCDDVLERSSQKSKSDRHVDLFDLVSDLKKETIKDEKSKEKEKDRAMEKGRVTEKGKERSKERENEKKRVKMQDMEQEKGKEEESVYVPHALAFKRSYATKKTYTEEELNAKLTRRVQKAARRQAKQEELKRLHRAQIIQRQLEQVEEKQRQLEERGVAVEKALRGEAGLYKGSSVSPKQRKRRSDYWGESNYSEILDLHLGVEPYVGTPRRRALYLCPCCAPKGMGKKDDPKLMQEWFKLVQEKNALVRYESELMIFARELELEDRQSRLQQELRERMAVDDHLKTEEELAEEKQILNEMLEVVEQRDSLVALLEEQRLREKEEDKDLESVMLSKGFSLNWA
ncbi:protein-methionine sulfoxide oxidase mical3a isoform X23 [Rhinichthys klamathensis goyatoka]|uniref:protein-methionine sulfoxide oxidase mical3a isoform X23 n=1 Tax=Rhinichthys klamathensis goyatoka TaxID=3034132 RepID=UPI0024B4A18D|nr:protein-methionine sulfoxide oxidase mical3a isoform X23 [Rhinichthys klamathensis goyatoka]